MTIPYQNIFYFHGCNCKQGVSNKIWDNSQLYLEDLDLFIRKNLNEQTIHCTVLLKLDTIKTRTSLQRPFWKPIKCGRYACGNRDHQIIHKDSKVSIHNSKNCYWMAPIKAKVISTVQYRNFSNLKNYGKTTSFCSFDRRVKVVRERKIGWVLEKGYARKDLAWPAVPYLLKSVF